MTDRQVRKIVAAGGSLDPRDIMLLRKAPKPVTLKDLTEIAKISETVERYDVVAALSEGRAKSAADARRQRAAETSDAPVEDPVEAAFKALDKAWARAPMAAKRRFITDHIDDILAQAEDMNVARAALIELVNGQAGEPTAPESDAPAFASRRGAA